MGLADTVCVPVLLLALLALLLLALALGVALYPAAGPAPAASDWLARLALAIERIETPLLPARAVELEPCAWRCCCRHFFRVHGVPRHV